MRRHIARSTTRHYQRYKVQCEKDNIPMSKMCIPDDVKEQLARENSDLYVLHSWCLRVYCF